MRKYCILCVLKHLTQAEVLDTESKLGYPLHKWYAVGHLAEAEAESIARRPDIAEKIRRIRLSYIASGVLDLYDVIEECANEAESVVSR